MRNLIPILTCLSVVAFTAAQPIYPTSPNWTSTDTPYSTGAALVDLDHDGWLDLVIANGNDMRRERLAVYYNTGAGTFPTLPDWQSADLEYNGHLDIADVNGDGWLDLAVGLTYHDGTPTVRIYLNNAGTLSSLPDWESNITYAGFQVAFGDVNGDGRPDLAVGTGWPYSGAHAWHNYVYLNTGTTLENTPSWTSADTYDLGDVIFHDVNRDGWLDLVGVGEGTHTWVYFNNAGSLNSTATWHTTNSIAQFGLMATLGDLDYDGYDELVIADNNQLGGGSGQFRRYDGLPDGPFTTSHTWSYYDGYASAVALADIDADDDLDLATGAWFDRTRYFLNNAGNLPTSPTWTSAGNSVVEAIVFADVDQDGRRYPTDTFAAVPGIHLYRLTRQPVDEIRSVEVDGVQLSPAQYTANTVHGWVSVGPQPQDTVTVRYAYSLKPEMVVSNWDDDLGNQLYYNQNDVPLFGDHNHDTIANIDDVPLMVACLTGPDDSGTLSPTCAVSDIDLDDDLDLVDFAWFATAINP